MNDKLTEKITNWCAENNIPEGKNEKFPYYFNPGDDICIYTQGKDGTTYTIDIKDNGLIILSKFIFEHNYDIVFKLNVIDCGSQTLQNWIAQNTDFTKFPTLTSFEFYG